jgi:hypothetical protein
MERADARPDEDTGHGETVYQNTQETMSADPGRGSAVLMR